MAKRPRGRPPLDPNDRSISVHVRITLKTFDRLCRDARDSRTSIPEAVRRSLQQRLKTQ